MALAPSRAKTPPPPQIEGNCPAMGTLMLMWVYFISSAQQGDSPTITRSSGRPGEPWPPAGALSFRTKLLLGPTTTVVVIVRPFAARVAFGCVFEYQRSHAVRITCCRGQCSSLPLALQRRGRVA